MDKRLKIFVIVIACLGILSLVFLLTSRKKPVSVVSNKQTSQVAKTNQSAGQTQAPAQTNIAPSATSAQQAPAAPQNVALQQAGQWQQCKIRKMDPTKKLVWAVQITEAIPQGGTYAKGYLNGDQNLLTHVIIKPAIATTEQIKARLVVGKKAFLQGNCVDVASDGAVVLQVF